MKFTPSQPCNVRTHTHSPMPSNIYKRVLKLTFKRNIPFVRLSTKIHTVKKEKEKKCSSKTATTKKQPIICNNIHGICFHMRVHFPLFSVVCLIPYVRREVSTFAWVPLPSSAMHTANTFHGNHISKCLNKRKQQQQQHLCLHISRVPLYQILVSPFCSWSLSCAHKQTSPPAQLDTGRTIGICVMHVIVYSVVIFILFASFAFLSYQHEQLCADGCRTMEMKRKQNRRERPKEMEKIMYLIAEWIII